MFFKVVVALLALTVGLYVQQSLEQADELPELQKAIILPKAKTINDFNFIDHNGDAFGPQNLRGYWTIAFFGFTNCPDICPTTMHTLKQIKAQVAAVDKWGNYQVLMISVDPVRDTPEQLKKYVPFFDPEFIGVTGSIDKLTDFAKQLGILFVAHEADEHGFYDVDHSTALVLFNPQGQMAGLISAPHKVDEISADLLTLADRFSNDHSATVVKSSTPNATAVALDSENNTELQLQNAWIRPAPPTANSLAGYFDIVNTSAQDITIVGSRSPQFDNTMIHDTVHNDGVASMQHRSELIIPANGRVSLKPLSTHMMLMQPVQALPAGSMVNIELIASDGRTFSYQIEVRQQAE